MMKNIIIVCLLSVILHACTNSKDTAKVELVKKWIGREILFPNNMVFTKLCKDTVAQFWPFHSNHSIVLYADSIDCLSCRLQLEKWRHFIDDCDSIFGIHIPVLIYFGSNDMHEISHVLKKDNFVYPVCVDLKDSLNILNHFPSDIDFQSFLLNKDNEVLAIGNPVQNPKVKELYFRIIQGGTVKPINEANNNQTEASVNRRIASLGRFDWQKEQEYVFIIKNVGDDLLLIEDVTTSCGCTTVTYSKEPVRSGQTVSLNVMYKAEQPEHFDKTITVYCNAKSSPVVLRITGDAE